MSCIHCDSNVIFKLLWSVAPFQKLSAPVVPFQEYCPKKLEKTKKIRHCETVSDFFIFVPKD